MVAPELTTLWQPLVRAIGDVIVTLQLGESASNHEVCVRLGQLLLRLWKWPLKKFGSRQVRAPTMLSRGAWSDVDSDAVSTLRASLEALKSDFKVLTEKEGWWKRYLPRSVDSEWFVCAAAAGIDSLRRFVTEEVQGAARLGRSGTDRARVLDLLLSAALVLLALHDRGEVHGKFGRNTTSTCTSTDVAVVTSSVSLTEQRTQRSTWTRFAGRRQKRSVSTTEQRMCPGPPMSSRRLFAS